MKKKVVFVIAILFLLVGCGTTLDTPTKKVEAFLNKYQKNDDEIVEQMDTSLFETEELTDVQKERYKEIMLNQYKNLTYEIKDETIDGNTAIVETEIGVYDYNTAISNSYTYLEENKDDFYEDEVLNTEAFIDYKLTQLENYTDRITYTITFNLTRTDSNSEWEIEDLSETDLQKIHGIYAN